MIPQTSTRVYLALGSTDLRKAINGLSILVEQAMGLNPFSGDLFVFCNRRQNIIKILYWDENGFCMWHNVAQSLKSSRLVFQSGLHISQHAFANHVASDECQTYSRCG